MEDTAIISLYWERDPEAIGATDAKYGGYCRTIAGNILKNREDAEECVNDTWLAAWNAMPPQRPSILSAFLGKITRNLSFDRWRSRRADKRGGGEVELVLEELEDCVSGESAEEALDRQGLVQAIDDFLSSLPEDRRSMFLLRYWYALPVGEIAGRLGTREGNVSAALHRLRKKLRAFLLERGYAV